MEVQDNQLQRQLSIFSVIRLRLATVRQQPSASVMEKPHVSRQQLRQRLSNQGANEPRAGSQIHKNRHQSALQLQRPISRRTFTQVLTVIPHLTERTAV